MYITVTGQQLPKTSNLVMFDYLTESLKIFSELLMQLTYERLHIEAVMRAYELLIFANTCCFMHIEGPR